MGEKSNLWTLLTMIKNYKLHIGNSTMVNVSHFLKK